MNGQEGNFEEKRGSFQSLRSTDGRTPGGVGIRGVSSLDTQNTYSTLEPKEK